jgi:hypothetical protein
MVKDQGDAREFQQNAVVSLHIVLIEFREM